MTKFSATLGRVVRSHRLSRGLSQEALAELSDLNRGYLGEIERGEVVPSIETARKIASALGEPLHELIREVEGHA